MLSKWNLTIFKIKFILIFYIDKASKHTHGQKGKPSPRLTYVYINNNNNNIKLLSLLLNFSDFKNGNESKLN